MGNMSIKLLENIGELENATKNNNKIILIIY